MRRRLATCMQAISPTVDTGFRGYGPARLILTAAHALNTAGVISRLNYAAPAGMSAEGTIALRLFPLWASGDADIVNVFSVDAGADANRVILQRLNNAAFKFSATGGGASAYVASAAISHAALAPLTIVARWRLPGTLDLNVNGTNITQAAAAVTLSATNTLRIGSGPNTSAPALAYIGPVIESPQYHSLDWTNSIQAGSGAAFASVERLKRYLSGGDRLYPLAGDSTGHEQQGGTSPYDDAKPLILFDGNSLTYGQGATPGVNGYPEQCAALLLADGYPVTWANLGVGSQQTPDMIADMRTQVLMRYWGGRKNIVCVWEGGNHMNTGGATPQQAHDSLATYCAAAQAVGFKVILLNVTPRSTPEDFNAKAVALNDLLAADWGDYADGYLDLYGNALVGIGAEQPGTYYDDNAHMSVAGYGVVAGIVKTAIEPLL